MQDKIKITVNGLDEACPAGSSIHDYLAARGVESARVVAELNGQILKPESFAGAVLREGDKVEFIRFVGGG